MFLFQTGSIRSGIDATLQLTPEEGFYSKLVRLEEHISMSAMSLLSEFLFQTGSIRSAAWSIIMTMPTWVSIPNWFD